jgi:hypothetical protein
MSCSTGFAQIFFVKNKGTTTINTILAKDHDKNNTTTNKQIGDKRQHPPNNYYYYTLVVVGLI